MVDKTDKLNQLFSLFAMASEIPEFPPQAIRDDLEKNKGWTFMVDLETFVNPAVSGGMLTFTPVWTDESTPSTNEETAKRFHRDYLESFQKISGGNNRPNHSGPNL